MAQKVLRAKWKRLVIIVITLLSPQTKMVVTSKQFSVWWLSHYIFLYTPGCLFTACLSIHLSICPFVDGIVFTLYFPPYSLDQFHILRFYQVTSEGVLHVMFCNISKLKFFTFSLICNFDLTLCPCIVNVKVDFLLQPLYIFHDDMSRWVWQSFFNCAFSLSICGGINVTDTEQKSITDYCVVRLF